MTTAKIHLHKPGSTRTTCGSVSIRAKQSILLSEVTCKRCITAAKKRSDMICSTCRLSLGRLPVELVGVEHLHSVGGVVCRGELVKAAGGQEGGR